MNKFLTRKGLSLTELLVAVILIGIVMLGVVGFSFAVRQIKVTTDKATVLTMHGAAVMNQFRKDALLATGYKRDPGIIIGSGDEINKTPMEWIAIRQDRESTPDDYTDDTWVIFAQFLGTNSLARCEQKTTEAGGDGPVPNVTSEGNCSNIKREILSNNIVTANLNIVTDKTALLKFYVTVYLETRFDPLTPMDPIKNPQYILETKVFPAKHSW